MMSSRPRRVTVLLDTLRAGGAERLAVDAACALDRDRYVTSFLVTRYSGSLEETLRAANIGCTVLDRKHGFHPKLFARACNVVAAGDLLHAHHLEGSMWGAALSRITNRPLIAHEHTFDGRRTIRRTYGYRFVIAPTAARIICVSERVASTLRAEGVPTRLLEVVPNGVPAPTLLRRGEARVELGLPAEGHVVGIVARLRSEKRHELALEAVHLLREQGLNIVLCIVGDGPCESDLRQRAHELDLDHTVVWAGERPNAARLLSAFDLTVLCSAFEGMPLAAIESLMAGIPLVATAVGALPDLLASGGGRLVPPNDPAALAQAIAAELSEARANRFDDLREQFGIERVARDLERIYDAVIREHDPGRSPPA